MVILHGGGLQLTDWDFWNRVRMASSSDYGEKPSLLLVDYAQNSTSEEYNFPMFVDIQRNQPNHHMALFTFFDVDVTDGSEKDLEKIDNADVVFVMGGCEDRLNEALRKHNAILNISNFILEQKGILVGHSAGVNFLSQYCYSNDRGGIYGGWGILNIKTFCHYSSQKWEQLNELQNHHPEFPTIPLVQGEYIRFERGVFMCYEECRSRMCQQCEDIQNIKLCEGDIYAKELDVNTFDKPSLESVYCTGDYVELTFSDGGIELIRTK